MNRNDVSPVARWLGMVLAGVGIYSTAILLVLARRAHVAPMVLGLAGSALFLGMIPGSLLGGRLLGRSGAPFVLRLAAWVSAALAAVSLASGSLLVLILLHGALGVLVGAIYPATSCSGHRSRRLAVAVFSGWAVGQATLNGLTLLLPHPSVRAMWDVSQGCVLGAAALLLILLARPPAGRPSPRPGRKDLRQPRVVPGAAVPAGAYVLVAVPWFLMDWTVYGLGLLVPSILITRGHLAALGGFRLDLASTLLQLVGIGAAFVLVERLPVVRLQAWGFWISALVLAPLALPSLPAAAGAAWLAVTLFAINAGPNATTWILPRAVAADDQAPVLQGIGTAASRVGAVCATFVLPVLLATGRLEILLAVVLCSQVLGAGTTLLGDRLHAVSSRACTPAPHPVMAVSDERG